MSGEDNGTASLQGSWVELHAGLGGGAAAAPPPAASALNGEMERILLDAQRESGASSSRSSSTHCDSPPLVPSPRGGLVTETDADKNSSQSDEDRVERSAEIESLLKKNPEWIWDWSSRPENAPRKELRFHQQHQRRHLLQLEQLSMRHSRAMQRGGVFSSDFLLVVLPGVIVTHIIALGIGILIGRKISAGAATSGTL